MAGHSGSKGRPQTQGFRRFTTAVAPATSSGLCCRNRKGRVLRGRGDPLSHSEVQVTDWMYFGLVEMSQAPFIQKRGTQGDSRSPGGCPSAPSSR